MSMEKLLTLIIQPSRNCYEANNMDCAGAGFWVAKVGMPANGEEATS